MPQLKFNWVDVIFVTLLIRICYVGYKRGFLPELLSFFGLIFALVLTANNYPHLSDLLSKWIKGESSPKIISIALLFLGTLLIFKILSKVIFFLIKSENPPTLNRTVGLILGIGRALLFSSMLLIAAILSPLEYLHKSIKEKSFFSLYILKIAPITYRFAAKFYPSVESENPLIDFLNKN